MVLIGQGLTQVGEEKDLAITLLGQVSAQYVADF
jgi:hypothetical protein